MNKLYVLTLAIAAFGVILLPQLGEAEMSELADEEMEKQLLYSPDFYFPLESEVGGVYSESGEEYEKMEEEKFGRHALEQKIEERVDAHFPKEYDPRMKVDSRTLKINVP